MRFCRKLDTKSLRRILSKKYAAHLLLLFFCENRANSKDHCTFLYLKRYQSRLVEVSNTKLVCIYYLFNQFSGHKKIVHSCKSKLLCNRAV